MAGITPDDTTAPLQVLPGVSALGWGYDVFGGRWADPASTTLPVAEVLTDSNPLRVDPYTVYACPINVAFQPVRTASVRAWTGSSIVQHQAELGRQADISGGYACFNGELSVVYDRASQDQETTAYTTCIDAYNLWRVRLIDNISKTFEFATDVVKYRDDPDGRPELFRKYGTHYIRDLVVGARALYKCATDTSKYTQSTSISEAAKASYAAFVKASVSQTESDVVTDFNASSQRVITTAGGDEVYAHDIATTGNYGKWLASVDSRPVFVDFGPASLQPIWTLILQPGEPVEPWEDAFDAYALEASVLPGSRPLPLHTDDVVVLQAVDTEHYIAANVSGDELKTAAGYFDNAARFQVKIMTSDPTVPAQVQLRGTPGSFTDNDPDALTVGHRTDGTVAIGFDVNNTDSTIFYVRLVEQTTLHTIVTLGNAADSYRWTYGSGTLVEDEAVKSMDNQRFYLYSV